MSKAEPDSRSPVCRSFLELAKGRRSKPRTNPFNSVLGCVFGSSFAIVFAILTVKTLIVADEPGVITAGENLYVAPAGSPLAVKVTLFVKAIPTPGVIAKW